jgi:hypothetical protein
MSKDPITTRIQSNGLRYKSKQPGSPFAPGSAGPATMSCFLCGKHRARSALQSRKLFGKTQYVCAPSCNAKPEEVAVAVVEPTPVVVAPSGESSGA